MNSFAPFQRADRFEYGKHPERAGAEGGKELSGVKFPFLTCFCVEITPLLPQVSVESMDPLGGWPVGWARSHREQLSKVVMSFFNAYQTSFVFSQSQCWRMWFPDAADGNSESDRQHLQVQLVQYSLPVVTTSASWLISLHL